MSMLAENRRKSKWVINPTKKPIWSTDSNGIKFGKQLMEKMGWSAGKGLGLNEQGIQEPLKVSFKNDTKGMGFKGNDDDWIEHQDEFNILLNQLRSNDDCSTVKDSVDKNEIKSLEEKSKQSKARVHYQKFTRGKDLSKYSENDLACILGTGKTKKKDKSKTEEVVESETRTNGNFETSFGVTTINSGSISDYFKKKWNAKPSGAAAEVDVEEDQENFRPCFSSGKSKCDDEIGVKSEVYEQNVIKRKHKLVSEEEPLPVEENRVAEFDNSENSERVGKRKKRKHRVESSEQEATESKKRRKNCNGFENSSKEYETVDSENSGNSEKEKKNDLHNINTVLSAEEVELQTDKREKKRKKRRIEVTNEGSDQINGTYNGLIASEEQTGRRKKKKKDRKDEENEINNSGCGGSCQPDLTSSLNECCLEVESVKNRKKKKKKLEKSEEIDSNIQDSHSTDRIKDWGVADTEKSNDACQGENSTDGGSDKKKKKRDKKEKLAKCDDPNLGSGSDNRSYSTVEVVTGREMIEKNENTLKLESGKKKKKSKREKLNENNQIEESCMAGMTTDKINEEEGALGDESVKKKKKKKDKKEKHVEIENKETEPCVEENTIQEECILDVESTRGKKKRKHKKKDNNEGIENKEEQEDEKTGRERGLNVGNNEVKDINTNEGRDRLQKLSGNLFPDQAADKYFPEQSRNERVLKLIRWANIEEFKGSNLSDVEGYGRRKMHEKQAR